MSEQRPSAGGRAGAAMVEEMEWRSVSGKRRKTRDESRESRRPTRGGGRRRAERARDGREGGLKAAMGVQGPVIGHKKVDDWGWNGWSDR